ncbi:MAG TPA: hypothetical protein VF281_00790 [Candidatus Saccharimonadales bacterium]
MAKPSGKKNGNASSEKNSGKNVLLTPEQHHENKVNSKKSGKKHRPSGLGNARGTLLNELERRSYQTEANNRAAAQSPQRVTTTAQSKQRIVATARIARTTRSAV